MKHPNNHSPSPKTREDRNRQADQIDINPYMIPEEGKENAKEVYRFIHDELELNKKPHLNLATFVSTWMEEEAKQLAMESIDVNLINRSIYPMTTEIQKRILFGIARLLRADFDPSNDPELGLIPLGKNSVQAGTEFASKKEPYIGTLTIGSSEAVMLAMLAHKRNWQNWYYSTGNEQRRERPELVIGGAYQVCWEKVYKFFDIKGSESGEDSRIIPLEEGRNVVTAEIIQQWIDTGKINNKTMAIGLVLGTTLTGEMDELKEINEVIRAYNDERRQNGFRIPIHIDAGYGGFVLPFIQEEEDLGRIQWDFHDLSEVQSINISNHKFGWVYPGLGTVIFRNSKVVPEELFTKVNYLGSEIYDYALNFSRPSFQVICQYYNFLRFGKKGYREIMTRVLESANYLSWKLTSMEFLQEEGEPIFEVLTSQKEGKVIFPNLVIKVNERGNVTAEAISERLSMDGWTVPHYSLPPNQEHVKVLRMVIKENMSMQMAKLLVNSFEKALAYLQTNRGEKELSSVSGTNVIC